MFKRTTTHTKQKTLRLAIKIRDNLTGSTRYRLLINDEVLRADFSDVKVAGETFITKATNLLMLSSTPMNFPKRLSKGKVMAMEYILNNDFEGEVFCAAESKGEPFAEFCGPSKPKDGRREL